MLAFLFQRQHDPAHPRRPAARIALTEIRKVPKLADCDQTSFLGAIMQCAQLGLEPGGALGHAYLIPFENRRKNITEVQFVVGYRGMLDLARRSGQIVSIEARPVYERDHFHVAFGLEPSLKHEPNWDAADRGELKFVYAVAKLKDGGPHHPVENSHKAWAEIKLAAVVIGTYAKPTPIAPSKSRAIYLEHPHD